MRQFTVARRGDLTRLHSYPLSLPGAVLECHGGLLWQISARVREPCSTTTLPCEYCPIVGFRAHNPKQVEFPAVWPYPRIWKSSSTRPKPLGGPRCSYNAHKKTTLLLANFLIW